MIRIISDTNSIFNNFIAEIRDKEIQKDRLRFRKNFERLGEIFAYEISKTLNYTATRVFTPLGEASVNMLSESLVLATILRAGLPFHNGLLNCFDKAENAFISAYRKYHKDGSFDIQFESLSSPSVKDKTIIISDPMLATGSSMVLGYKALIENGKPAHTHIATIIASNEGIEYIEKNLPADEITIWAGAVDNELTAKAYIVPGLGDAGDLAYGGKSSE